MSPVASLGVLFCIAFFILDASGEPGNPEDRQDQVESAFQAFIQKYGRHYPDMQEQEQRFSIFKKNYAFVEANNAKGGSYTLAVNEFADQTPDEFAATRLGLSTKSHDQWAGLPHLGTDHYSGVALPESIDWTAEGAVTPPKNQAQCGSCWAFSTTGALEGAWKIASGALVSMSEQQLIDCSTKDGNAGCQGGSMEAAFQFESHTAVCTEDSYPYKAKNGVCRQSGCEVGIPREAITGFRNVHPKDESALMEAVSKQPVSVAIEADQMVFQLYSRGILSKECGVKLDHGVLLVGYGTEDGVDYWKVKNSWGAGWGEEGFVRLERGGLTDAGECGIKLDPSYPVVKAVPGPTPSPPPGPAPASSHYEKPPCQSSEVEARIQGADGVLCAPPCDGDSCPEDVPTGTTAQPQCVLKSPAGTSYCALICENGDECPQGSTCKQLGNALGVCLYEDSTSLKSAVVLARSSNAGKATVVV